MKTLKNKLKKLNEHNSNLDWKMNTLLKEKDESVKQLRELEILQKFKN